jgi:hypothetical protein
MPAVSGTLSEVIELRLEATHEELAELTQNDLAIVEEIYKQPLKILSKLAYE